MAALGSGGGLRRTAGTTKPVGYTNPIFKNPAATQRTAAGSDPAFTPGGLAAGAIAGSGATPYPARVPTTGSAAPARTPQPIAPRYAPGTQIAPGSTGSYGGSAAAMVEPAAVSPLGDQEWAAQDSTYLTEQGGINAELENLINMLKQQRANYDTDFGESMDNLGWEGDPLGNGRWDTDDTLGAYGQAYKGQQEDFAGRGMLTSSFFGNANAELNNRFNEQRNDMLAGRQRQMGAWDMEQNQGQSRAQQALAQALASSYARRAAQYGL